MGMTYKQKLEKAESLGISFSEKLHKKVNENPEDKDIVGIYKFFSCKDGEEECFYIGKSTTITYRLLGASNGHIYMFLNKDYSKIVPLKIKEYLDEGYKIRVEICEVSYKDTNFSRAAHRLALRELEEIVKYQEMGQCLFQVPEGVGTYEEQFWEKNYRQK